MAGYNNFNAVPNSFKHYLNHRRNDNGPEQANDRLQYAIQQADEIQQEETEQRDKIDENDTNLPPVADLLSSSQQKVVKKRGRPKTLDGNRDWSDEEIVKLIELWAQQENLYNTKHKLYFNRDIHQKSIETIERALQEAHITATSKQIGKKIMDLKVESSQWKFYKSLNFLNDAFTPRKTHSNVDESPYDVSQPPSKKSSHKIADTQAENVNKVMASAANALEKLVTSREKSTTKESEKSEDEIFCELLHKLLAQVPEGEQKDDLKISIQQMVIKKKHQILRSPPGLPFNSPQGDNSSHSSSGHSSSALNTRTDFSLIHSPPPSSYDSFRLPYANN